MRRLSASVLFVFVTAAGFGVAACSSSEPDSYPPGLPWLGGQVETGEAELPNRRDGGTDGGGSTLELDFIPDTSTAGIRSFVTSQYYAHWRSTGTRAVDSDHGDTRGIVFVNPALYEALDDPPPYPDGSTAILRLVETQSQDVVGYNVLVKNNGQWRFYKDIEPAVHGIDPAPCASCHHAGTDYIRTPRSAF